MYTSVPSFWSVPAQAGCVDQNGNPAQDCWQVLIDSLNTNFPGGGKNNIVVVGDDTWPTGGPGGGPIPGTVNVVNNRLGPTGCTILGYVTIRGSAPPYNLRPAQDVANETAAWLNQFNLDGIYFDMAVLPGYDINAVKPYVTTYRQNHAGKQLMILAGMCADPWVIAGGAAGPDYALMWEDTEGQYRDVYGASDRVDQAANLEVPDWWKDPANQPKIAHTVHTTGAGDDWQVALGLAVERNAGNLFVLDTAGPYSHLPPYWWTASGWMNSYNTHYVGLSNELLLRAAHLWGDQQGKLHAWPNGEQAWYGAGQVRGTFTLDAPASADIVKKVIALPGNPPLYNVSKVWAAAHTWAVGLPDEGLGAPSAGRVRVRRDPRPRLPGLLGVSLTPSYVGHQVSLACSSPVGLVVSTARSSLPATPGPSVDWRLGWGACPCGTTGRRSDVSPRGPLRSQRSRRTAPRGVFRLSSLITPSLRGHRCRVNLPGSSTRRAQGASEVLISWCENGRKIPSAASSKGSR
jgi:hypothetical protein